jgi:3-hydroxyisobutyrate dehydrogenase-like beta-hydroxyacid dehydrogenase
MEKIVMLHPGQMGVSIAASAKNGGNAVYWVSDGRSTETRARAEQYGLVELGTLAEAATIATIIISVCPPHAAETVADQVAAAGFKGIYLDANAISPQRARRIGDRLTAVNATFVDGGIIGGPAWEPNRTWLYLSGKEADRVADCFSNGPLAVEVIGDEPGKASALKMCFAAYTKGTTALLCGILATAESLSVREDLERQWSRNGSDFAVETAERVRRVTAKAWRFAGEMEEIAATFELAGIPGGFHLAASDIYQRIAHFKGAEETPELAAVLAALQKSKSVIK